MIPDAAPVSNFQLFSQNARRRRAQKSNKCSYGFVMSHLFAFFLLVGCGDSQQSPIEKIPLAPDGVELHADDSSTDHASVETSADGSAWTKIVDMRFDIPKEWKKVQLTGMQASILAAKYVLANYSPDLELTVSRGYQNHPIASVLPG